MGAKGSQWILMVPMAPNESQCLNVEHILHMIEMNEPHILDISGTYPGIYLGHVCDIYWTYQGHVGDISRIYLGHICDISKTYLCTIWIGPKIA